MKGGERVADDQNKVRETLGIIDTAVGGKQTDMFVALLGTDQIMSVFVQCRLGNGADVHVPLADIFDLFERYLARKMRMEAR